jgi:hypothetical protein
MSRDSFENRCILCYDKDITYYDNSMNNIENNENNENSELIDYKHCLNIKVHPQCLCMWFIKQRNECLICRKKLDISHNVLNDTNVFIVNIQKQDYSEFDIIYPFKCISIEYHKSNRSELPPLDVDIDIRSYTAIESINNINNINIGIGDIGDIDDSGRINIMRFTPILGTIKAMLYLIIIYTCGFYVKIIYNFINNL